jgi:hypothetical protein
MIWRVPMRPFISKLKLPALISLFLVVPFIVLELVNRRNLPEDFPIVLFLFLWVLSIIFISVLTPIIHGFWREKPIIANWGSLLLRLAFLIPVGWVWIAIILDQMPCFLGVPICD